MRRIVILIVILLISYAYGDVQIDNMNRLTTDLLGFKYASMFEYSLKSQTTNGLDYFEIESKTIGSDVHILISGSNGVSMASGLNWYLKYYMNSEISWGELDTWKQITIPTVLPVVPVKVHQETRYKHRYYLNVCTVSYTMAWWDEERWLREIDWAALQGFNEILSFTGQEYVFKKTFESFGLSEKDIFDFFAGPAFLAWGRMANIKHYPGPLDNQFLEDQRDIELKIIERVRNYGMKNIFPAFAGFIPDKMKTLFPSMKTLKSSNWCYFNDTYSGVYMIDPSDEMLPKVARKFLEEQTALYGTDHLYNCDLFNEMSPPSGDLKYLSDVAKSVIDSMLAVDSQAIWVMQGWLFLNAEYFWTKERVKAFLDAVPTSNMLILDLSTDDRAQWSRLDSYYSKEWVYNVLHNFGGRRAIYGNLDNIIKQLNYAHESGSSITGIGLTMEAIDQNPVVYEFTTELIWSKDIKTLEWLFYYGLRRAGVAATSKAGRYIQDAWLHLYNSSYSSNVAMYDAAFNTFSQRPGPQAGQNFGWTNVTDTVYVMRQFYQATVEGMAQYGKMGEPHYYDLIDVTRQVISNYFVDVITMANGAYQRRSIQSFTKLSNFALEMMIALDDLLNTNVNYQLGQWTEKAKKFGHGIDERVRFYDYNAKLQVSTWAFFNNGILLDYSVKQWSGLIKDYNYKRWQLYFEQILVDLNGGAAYDHGRFSNDVWNKVESAFYMSDASYPSTPKGNTTDSVAAIIAKYATFNKDSYEVYKDTDYNGADLHPAKTQLWTRDVAQLAIICDNDPECAGFISTGYLKKNGGTMKPYTGCDYYRKKV